MPSQLFEKHDWPGPGGPICLRPDPSLLSTVEGMRSSKLLARRLKSSGAAAEGAASSQEEKMARSFNVSSTLRW
uniref:Uncharacterized protein n=1 Tax=Mesocestoides corti TaxID=53468 RepID=A0A5K3FWQ7_MESCO